MNSIGLPDRKEVYFDSFTSFLKTTHCFNASRASTAGYPNMVFPAGISPVTPEPAPTIAPTGPKTNPTTLPIIVPAAVVLFLISLF